MAAKKSTRFNCPRHWTLAQRLAHYTAAPNERGCKLWTGATPGIYGRLRWRRQNIPAHRLAWQLAYGAIPDGLLVCHKCDVPACVNIEHLFLGTSADNARDRDTKGRQARQKGEAHGGAKLTEQQVIAIRADSRRQCVIAKAYGIRESTVSMIMLRQNWKHI